MTYGLHDFLGNVGVLAVLVAYLLLQLGRMSPMGIPYGLLNAVGALLILYSLSYDFNLSAVLIEVSWLAISLFGIWRSIRRSAS